MPSETWKKAKHLFLRRLDTCYIMLYHMLQVYHMYIICYYIQQFLPFCAIRPCPPGGNRSRLQLLLRDDDRRPSPRGWGSSSCARRSPWRDRPVKEANARTHWSVSTHPNAMSTELGKIKWLSFTISGVDMTESV